MIKTILGNEFNSLKIWNLTKAPSASQPMITFIIIFSFWNFYSRFLLDFHAMKSIISPTFINAIQCRPVHYPLSTRFYKTPWIQLNISLTVVRNYEITPAALFDNWWIVNTAFAYRTTTIELRCKRLFDGFFFQLCLILHFARVVCL